MKILPILELENVKGVKRKKEILLYYKDDKSFRDFLYYALNPMITYNLSEDTLREPPDTKTTRNLRFRDIFSCCDYLSSRKGIDKQTVEDVKEFLYSCPETERELFKQLLSKKLRLGVTASTVNQVFPGLIPCWRVQEAYIIDKYPIPDGEYFWLTQKLNGNRATFYKGKMYTRTGTVYSGLDHIVSEIGWADSEGLVLDGELTLLDPGTLSDNEAFRVATGILNAENVDKTSICYTIFDAIPIEDFDNEHPSVPYSDRRKLLSKVSEILNNHGGSYVKVLPVLYCGTDQTVIPELLSQMVEEDKEGLMANLDVPYKRIRHRGILKIKRFYTMDLPITGVEEGTGRLSGTLGNLTVDFKSNTVRVGSGFSDQMRDKLWNERDSICGKLCEVKYKEISRDKTTHKDSLQFPIFIRMREDKSEVSYD